MDGILFILLIIFFVPGAAFKT